MINVTFALIQPGVNNLYNEYEARMRKLWGTEVLPNHSTYKPSLQMNAAKFCADLFANNGCHQISSES